MSVDRASLDGRVVILLGAGGGGMGTYTALSVAGAGAKLVAVDLSREIVGDTVARVQEAGGTVHGIAADVRDPGALEDILEQTLATFGRVDGLVNLVGGIRLATATSNGTGATWVPVHECSDEVYDEMIALNLTYVFRMCRLVSRQMIEQGGGGAIVNFGSISALHASPYHAAYGAAKAAVMSLTQSLAAELGEFGIRVNCIVPGSTPAPGQSAATPAGSQNMNDRAATRSPLGRRVNPQETGDAVLFLLSDLSGGITGHSLPVDVGASTNHPNGSAQDFKRTAELLRAGG